MNHDFDNEFETDDELKRGRSRRKDGRKYASSGLTGRTGSTGRGSRTARTAARSGKSRLRTITFYCGRDHCTGTDRRRLVWKAYDVPDADGYRV